MVIDARFEWPGPGHGGIILHRAVKKQDRRVRIAATDLGSANCPRLRRLPVNRKIVVNERHGSPSHFPSFTSFCRRATGANDHERPGGVRTRAEITLQTRRANFTRVPLSDSPPL